MKVAVPLALALLVLAGGLGRMAEEARRDAGIPLSRARVPLGGFEPLAVDILWLRAEALRADHHLTEAAAAYLLVTELQPKVAGAYALPALLLAWTEAEGSDPEREWRWIERALGILERGLAENPDHPELLLALGTLYYRRIVLEPDVYDLARERLGRPPELAVVETFGRLMDRMPDRVTGFVADAWLLLAERREAAGDFAGAREAYGKALPLWHRIADRQGGGEPAEVARRIEERLARLPPR